MIFFIALSVFLATLCGGLFAIRFKDKLHLIIGFSAGALIGVAFFDLLPEALNLSFTEYSSRTIISVVALGFSLFMILDRMFSLHAHDDDTCHNVRHKKIIGAGSLSVHSFLDGLTIGFSFHISFVVGAVVTLAVLAHDFSDGINTVSIIFKNNGSRREAFRWLFWDAVAPVLGITLSSCITISAPTLGLLLALFCGFFLYIGASDLLPESHHAHPTHWTTISTLLGIGLLYTVVHFVAL